MTMKYISTCWKARLSFFWFSRAVQWHVTGTTLLKRYRRDPAKIYFTTRYSGWNVDPPLQFWARTTKHAMERTKSVKIVISLHYITPFFHVVCKQPTTAKMHKIFIAQKSYCACRVLSLATIRSKYYFNFILNGTRSGRELLDRPSESKETPFREQWSLVREIWRSSSHAKTVADSRTL